MPFMSAQADSEGPAPDVEAPAAAAKPAAAAAPDGAALDAAAGAAPAARADAPPAQQQQQQQQPEPAGALATSASAASLAASADSGSAGAANTTLYLGNLHPFVTEATLQEVFAGCAGVAELKVIKDKATGIAAGYGFAKFDDPGAAHAALGKVNKTLLFGQEMRANWAFQKEHQEEVAHHVHVFVGDLSADVTDAALLAAFAGLPGCSDARVMWDHGTGRSRGYGFVSFASKPQADAAIAAMHGQFVGARRVRCGWAQHKTDAVAAPVDAAAMDRADPTNTNVYAGNLAPGLTDAEVRRAFGAYGPVTEVKLYRKGAYGFVRFKAHADAVRAIVGMNGAPLGGQPLKCSWGRHPNTPPSGVQTSLMLAAAAGLGPLAGAPHMHAGAGGLAGMGAGAGHGMPMAAHAAAGVLGMHHHHGGAGLAGGQPLQPGLGGLDVQHVAYMQPHAHPYGGAAFFGAGQPLQ